MFKVGFAQTSGAKLNVCRGRGRKFGAAIKFLADKHYNYILDPKPCLPKLHPAAWSSCPSLRTSSMHGVADQRRLHFAIGVRSGSPKPYSFP